MASDPSTQTFPVYLPSKATLSQSHNLARMKRPFDLSSWGNVLLSRDIERTSTRLPTNTEAITEKLERIRSPTEMADGESFLFRQEQAR